MNILYNKSANFFNFPLVVLTAMLLKDSARNIAFCKLICRSRRNLPQQNLHDFADIHSHEAG